MLRTKLPFVFTLCFSLCFASPQQNTGIAATPAQASIVGSVIDAQTGKPLDDVHVQVISLPADNQPGQPEFVYGAMSMSNGLFSILGIQPGSYLVRASKNGLVQQPGRKVSDNMLVVKSGEQTNLDLKMTAVATLSGVVLDEYGDPLPGIYVVAEPLDKSLLPGIDLIGNGTTDDRGQFRFLTTPGKYRLRTQLSNGVDSGLPEIRTDGTQPAKYRDVFFPGTESPAMAAIIDVKPGEERNGSEFHLTSIPALSITGFLSNPPANLETCSLDVTWGPAADRMQSGSGGTQLVYGQDAKRINRFALGDLKPGFYKVRAHCQTDAGTLYSQIEAINLTNAGVENVALHLSTGFEVTGMLIPRRLWPSSGAQPRIGLQATDAMLMSAQSVDVATVGSFTIKNVMPGHYRVAVEPLPENAFIASIQSNGSSPSSKIVNLSDSSSTLKVTVSDQGAEISGAVHDLQGRPQSFLTMVFLQPEKEEPRIEDSLSSRVDGQGKYSIKTVPPGTYRLFALGFESFAAGAGTGSFTRASRSAELVVIKPGARITMDLKTTQSGETDAAAK